MRVVFGTAMGAGSPTRCSGVRGDCHVVSLEPHVFLMDTLPWVTHLVVAEGENVPVSLAVPLVVLIRT